jgi:hypothetical protein
MKKLDVSVLGSKFEIYLEDEFFEYVKDDIEKLQTPTPQEILHLFLNMKKEIFEMNKKIEEILKKLDDK